MDLADEDDRARWARTLWLWPVLAVVTGADLVLIKTTFNLVLRGDEAMSWFLGAGLTLASVVAAFHAGSHLRMALGSRHDDRSHRWLAIALGLGWAAMGLAIFWLRWKAADFAPTPMDFEGASASTEAGREEAKEQILAVILAAVYLLSGLLAFTDGFRHTNPAARAMQAVQRQIRSLTPALEGKEGRVARLLENRAIHEHELATIDQAARTALASRRALAGELKAHARVQIAIHLADPSKTSLVRLSEPTAATSPEESPAPSQDLGQQRGDDDAAAARPRDEK